jgi:antitoxin component YwqK of YwqJK toxin-antitoxin module
MKNFKFNVKWRVISNIWVKCYYKNGLLNGEYIFYYYNEEISKCYYKNDIRDGKCV